MSDVELLEINRLDWKVTSDLLVATEHHRECYLATLRRVYYPEDHKPEIERMIAELQRLTDEVSR
jgi:hypothetical protein